MTIQAKLREYRLLVGGENLAGLFPRIKREQNGDKPPDDMSVAIAPETQDRVRSVSFRMRDQPHLACAAANFRPGRALGILQRLQFAAKLDQIAIPVLPIVEQAEIIDDLFDLHLHRP